MNYVAFVFVLSLFLCSSFSQLDKKNPHLSDNQIQNNDKEHWQLLQTFRGAFYNHLTNFNWVEVPYTQGLEICFLLFKHPNLKNNCKTFCD